MKFTLAVSALASQDTQYVFPALERTVFTKTSYVLVPLELLIHGFLIGSSFIYKELDGVWFSLFLAAIFGLVHLGNLRYRKYCLATWCFDGTYFHIDVKNQRRSISIQEPFCICAAMLSFSRRYGQKTYPFILLWRPGEDAPYEKMNGYQALKKRKALILPLDATTTEILEEQLHITQIPKWPQSGVFQRLP